MIEFDDLPPKFENFPPDLKSQRRGLLYKIIQDELYPDQEKADQICKRFTIKESNFLHNDKEIIDNFFKDLSLSKTWDLGIYTGEDKEKKDMEWIVLGGLILVGLASQYLSKKQSKTKEKEISKIKSPSRESLPPSPPPIPAVLSLVVPASEVSHLKEGIEISPRDIEEIIDKASYFLCSSITEAKGLQLETTDEAIPSQSQREVYIKIEILNGRQLIGKTNLYPLKRDLPPDQNGVIRQLKCLNSLSGLEKFNRV